jgi:putative DNA primase/helicase
LLLKRWVISAVAAALEPEGFSCRGVLTLQGPQSIGKTRWANALVSDPALAKQVIKLGHHLDGANKDSLLGAITHWIVEIGELDSSFKKDIARLKGFLTNDADKVRRPYGKGDSEYPRRSVFCATVNDPKFLVDTTGNSRFWVIPVTRVDYGHGIDMQQLFAQLAEDFKNGERWWLSSSEDGCLEEYNKRHRNVSVVEERILAELALDRKDERQLPAMTATEVLKEVGIDHPTNGQCKEATTVLREHLGESRRIKGLEKWRVPLKSDFRSMPITSIDDDDEDAY